MNRFTNWVERRSIPFKSNSVAGEAGTLWEKAFNYFQFKREDFLKFYHKRSLVETPFSMVKAKFGDSVRSRSDVAMKNEVLLKFLCHNICCPIMAQHELGIEPIFLGDASPKKASTQVQESVAVAAIEPSRIMDFGLDDFRFSDLGYWAIAHINLSLGWQWKSSKLEQLVLFFRIFRYS